MTEERSFTFRFDPSLARWAKLFGILPTRSYVRAGADGLEAVFGHWRIATPWTNVVDVQRTGPYTAWKIAGPAHLSVADRGITFAATADGGACVRFRVPVRGIDPFGLIRHPGATLGLEDVDGFITSVREHLAAAPTAPPSSEADEAPTQPSGNFTTALKSAWNFRRRRRSIDEHERDVDRIDPPPVRTAANDDGQPIEDGVGSRFHRRYRVGVTGSPLSAEEAMSAVQADPNQVAKDDLAPFNKIEGVAGTMRVGDRFLIEVPGPWKGSVEVVEVDDRCFRLATLDAHMEAGVIEFRTERLDGHLSLTIESWARSGDHAFDALYDHMGLGKAMQGEMWVIACERFVALVGGAQDGPVDVTTERERDPA